MEPRSLTVLYEEEEWLAVYKPAGIPVHASRLHPGVNSIVGLLSERLGSAVFNTHRLDKPTSGVLVLARNPGAARMINDLFAGKQVSKRYLAVVRGWPPAEFRIDRPLRQEKTGPLQSAATEFRVLNRCELPVPNAGFSTTRFSLLQALPETGRNHQIRRHLAGAGYPVIGDTSHGDLRINRTVFDLLGVDRLMLHASALMFLHPSNGIPIQLLAPPDESLKRLLNHFDFV